MHAATFDGSHWAPTPRFEATGKFSLGGVPANQEQVLKRAP